MSQPLFFNGQQYVTPVTLSAVNDDAMADSTPSVGNNLVLIGHSLAGRPKTPMPYSNPTDLGNALVGGELQVAGVKAFAPSTDTGGPNQVYVMRVDPATQSLLTLLDDDGNDAILINSTDYGLRTAGIKLKVETGTNTGKRLTTALGLATYAGDNTARRLFQIQYSGALATATMDIIGDTLTLSAPTGTAVATLDLNVFGTVQQLVDAIDAVPDFAATILDGNQLKATLNSIDYVTAQDVKTAVYVVRADLQACVDFLNGAGEGLVDAVRAPDAGAPPANIPYTYLAGGSDGTATNTDWSDCLQVLQTANVQRVVALSPDPSIAAMVSAHVTFMSTQGRRERRGYTGGDIGDAIADVVADAAGLNSDRMSQIYPGYWDFDSTGALTLYPSYMSAALIGAMAAAVTPGTALTNKELTVRGLEFALKNPTDTDVLIQGGVCCLEDTDQGFKVVKSNTTWLQNNNFNRVEDSTGAAVDFATQSLRQALDVLRGGGASPAALGRALKITDSTCRDLSKPAPNGPGIFVGDANSPPYKNIQVGVVGDRIAVTLQGSPIVPANFVTITLYIVPYSGTISSQ